MLYVKQHKIPAGREIGKAVRDVFGAQLMQADAGKSNFANWDARLARALKQPLFALYMSEAGKRRRELDPTGALDERKIAAELTHHANRRAAELAHELNNTSTKWIEEGRDPDSVFSLDRAAGIAVTEGSQASHDVYVTMAKLAGKTRLKWKIRNDACAQCRKLNGKIIQMGSDFVSSNGTRVKHPPLHPSCNCTVEVV